jgi:hypothetical protein
MQADEEAWKIAHEAVISRECVMRFLTFGFSHRKKPN